MKKTLSLFLGSALVLSLMSSVLAAEEYPSVDAAASFLQEQGIMVGNENGDMMLDRGLTRVQLAAILARMTVNQEHLEADKEFYSNKCAFTDVPTWAKHYVGYCATNYLVSGYGNGLYGSNDPVTSAAACAVMLRCLDDVESEWTYSTAIQTAIAEGLAPAEAVDGAEITRGNMALLIYCTMARMGYDVDLSEQIGSEILSKNSDGSINVPSDGSRYIPQVGDVIRCDDGTNYKITDVSRYDKSMFASGPVGELPIPTCDWSLLAQPDMPVAETRRYHLDTGDYLFVRNLYETRRMLYTLYNAVGNNPETWANGKPLLRADGSQKVRIELTIPANITPQVFWPWRESEVVDLFAACPTGLYQMEVWDVYKDGVFLRTEYNIHSF